MEKYVYMELDIIQGLGESLEKLKEKYKYILMWQIIKLIITYLWLEKKMKRG